MMNKSTGSRERHHHAKHRSGPKEKEKGKEIRGSDCHTSRVHKPWGNATRTGVIWSGDLYPRQLTTSMKDVLIINTSPFALHT